MTDATTPNDAIRASALIERIGELARAVDNPALLAIDADPETHRLLGLASDSARRQAEVHLESARRWRQGRFAANRRRLGEVRKALDAYDLVLARSLLHRIEAQYLDDEGAELRDALFLELEARAMESEDLDRQVADVDDPTSRRKRRWWRRN